MSPTPAAGAAVVYENHSLLNIHSEVPDPPSPPRRVGRPSDARRRKNVSTTESPEVRQSGSGHSRQVNSQVGLPEMIARGLLDRGEALGINKTLMNAVSEIKVHSAFVFEGLRLADITDNSETCLT